MWKVDYESFVLFVGMRRGNFSKNRCYEVEAGPVSFPRFSNKCRYFYLHSAAANGCSPFLGRKSTIPRVPPPFSSSINDMIYSAG